MASAAPHEATGPGNLYDEHRVTEFKPSLQKPSCFHGGTVIRLCMQQESRALARHGTIPSLKLMVNSTASATPQIRNFVAGEFVDGVRTFDKFSPMDGRPHRPRA